MYTKLCVLLLAVALSQAVPHVLMPEISLMQFMIKSRAATQDNPAGSLGCFDEYLPQLSAIADQYKAQYAQCLTNAEASREGIDDSTKDERTQIDGAATDACTALSKCSQSTGSIDYFSCYSSVASDNTKTMYTISANSAEMLVQVQEDYRLIDNVQYACTNKSERAYVENTALAYDNFDRCVKGLEPLTTTGAPTEAPTDAPTSAPTTVPTAAPTEAPTAAPTAAPTEAPTAAPTAAPTEAPTAAPTAAPTEAPTAAPTAAPTEAPTAAPTAAPTEAPTAAPTAAPDSTVAPKENLPEEDLSRLAEEQNKLKQMVEDMKQWFKRQ